MSGLELNSVTVRYGHVEALTDLSMSVGRGEVVALLGANGAGKTTTLKAIMGMVAPSAGSISLDGTDMAGQPSYMAARRGVALIPEGRRIFKRMTVTENLKVGAVSRSSAETAKAMEDVHELFPRLSERGGQLAGTLSGGEQQMLAIGRALMAGPRYLLFDEPSLGLAPLIVEDVMNAVLRISREFGIGGILVEQNVEVALSVASKAYVLTRGATALSGTSEDVRNSPLLHQAYLGLSN